MARLLAPLDATVGDSWCTAYIRDSCLAPGPAAAASVLKAPVGPHGDVAAAVRDVYVNGALTVHNHEVLTMDQDEVHDRLQAGQDRSLLRVPGLDWAGRSADEINPLCLPVDGEP